MPSWLETLLAILGALGIREGLALWMTQRARRRVTEAEAHKLEADADLTEATAGEKTLSAVWKLVEKLEACQDELEGRIDKQEVEMASLRARIAEQDRLINEWRIGIDRLVAQIIDLKQTPVWKPRTGPLKGGKGDV